MNLNNFGKNLKFNQRSEKSKKVLTEKELFIELMTMLEETWDRSNESYEKYKINLLEYEESFYQMIEGFMFLKYGDWKTEIALWYIFIRKDEEGEILPLKVKFHNKKEDEEIYLKNATDLWDILERLDKEENNK
jgi:hypothetical protein